MYAFDRAMNHLDKVRSHMQGFRVCAAQWARLSIGSCCRSTACMLSRGVHAACQRWRHSHRVSCRLSHATCCVQAFGFFARLWCSTNLGKDQTSTAVRPVEDVGCDRFHVCHRVQAFGFVAAPHTYVSRKDEGDKLVVLERGDVVMVFNFHPTNSYQDYRVGCLLPGPYKVRRHGAQILPIQLPLHKQLPGLPRRLPAAGSLQGASPWPTISSVLAAAETTGSACYWSSATWGLPALSLLVCRSLWLVCSADKSIASLHAATRL
jgi:Alpha amylase, C-terminal all-beta domain